MYSVRQVLIQYAYYTPLVTMGKPNKGGKSNHRNKRKTSQPSSKAPDPDADALVIELSAGVSFYSALARRGARNRVGNDAP